jgi:hypothetical protein
MEDREMEEEDRTSIIYQLKKITYKMSESIQSVSLYSCGIFSIRAMSWTVL